MSQTFEEYLPLIENQDSFSAQSQAKIKLPKKTEFNYSFAWVPMNPQDLPKDTFPYPVPSNNLLYCFRMLAMSRPCNSCGIMILPKLSENMKVSPLCKKCKLIPKRQEPQKTTDLKRSSTVDRLRELLDSIFIKYHLNTEFQESADYTKRWQQHTNHEIYIKFTIIKDAVEVASCIDSLITFDHWPARYFVWNGKTHHQLLQSVVENDGILKMEPFYRLLMMPTSILKAKEMITIPMMRGARVSPGNVTNMSNLQKK